MKSKTLSLIERHIKFLTEQGEDPAAMEQPPQEGGMDVQDVTEPAPTGEEETMPLTSQGEEKYIKDLIDAALFEPSAEEATSLLNLQSAMEMKRYKNAREEILPTVLSIISKETQANGLRSQLDDLER